MKPKVRKPPIIRRHNKTPYIKGTNPQVRERIEFCAALLLKQATKTQIHRAMALNFGLNWSTVDRIYIPRAKEFICERSNVSKADMHTLTIAVILDVLKSDDNHVRLKATQQLIDLFGLKAPTRQEISGPQGGQIKFEQKPKQPFDYDGYRKLCYEVFGNGRGNGNGESVHPAPKATDADAPPC